MAQIKMISVSIELIESNGQRRQLEEFDTTDTLKEHANSAHRHTKAIEARPGLFAILIHVDKCYDWVTETANALKLVLSFDDGHLVENHELVILRPGPGASDLASRLKLGTDTIMTLTEEQAAFYRLDSIGMPLEHSGEAWYKARLNFERIARNRNVDTLPIEELDQVGCTEIRIDIIPCKVYPADKTRDKVHTRGQRRPDLLRNVHLGINPLFDPECQVARRIHYAIRWCSKTKHTFVFLYSEVYRRKEIPPELIDFDDTGGGRVPKIKPSPLTTPKANRKPKQTLTRTPGASCRTVPSRPAKKCVIPLRGTEDCGQQACKTSAKSPKRLFGNSVDWNVVNGLTRCATMPATSPQTPVTPKSMRTANSSPLFEQQSPSSTPDASLCEIRAELRYIDVAKQEIQEEKQTVRAEIRAQKVQNNLKILVIDRKMDDMIGTLNGLKLNKEQLLKEQDELTAQEMRLDDEDEGVDENLLSATRSVRLYKTQQLQRLETIRKNKKRRLSQVGPGSEQSCGSTITVKIPSLT